MLTSKLQTVQSKRFAAFDPGYITNADVFGNINIFFKAPAYTHDVAEYSESTKQPSAISELISLTPSLLKLNATTFKGPALVISGEYDGACGGYCPNELVILLFTLILTPIVMLIHKFAAGPKLCTPFHRCEEFRNLYPAFIRPWTELCHECHGVLWRRFRIFGKEWLLR